MNLHSSTTRKPTVLSKRISLVGLTAVATAALMFSAESASAGTKELKALDAALKSQNPPASIQQATPEQLAAAVTAVIGTNIKIAGIVAGEALKTQAALDSNAGAKIADAALAVLGANPAPTALQKLVGDAAKTAGTSKGANVEEVPAFASQALSQTADALAAAKIAKASKAGAGAILGGLAGELTGDAAKTALANQALADKTLTPAVTEIARAVGATVDDPAAFAVSVAGANTKLALKVAPGVVASNPTDARVITAALLDNAALKPTLTKGAALLAKSVAAVADVEQISGVGSLIADQIGAGAIKTSAAAGIAKTLAQAIIAKPTSGINKADEVGEVAAYIVGGIVNNAGFTAKAAPKLVLAIIKSAIAGGKASAKQIKSGLSAADASYVADVVGSVARTLANTTISSDVKVAIQTLLSKSTKSIGGKTGAATVQAALDLGFANTPAAAQAGYENGTARSAADLAAIVDPETDNKNL